MKRENNGCADTVEMVFMNAMDGFIIRNKYVSHVGHFSYHKIRFRTCVLSDSQASMSAFSFPFPLPASALVH